MCYVESQTTHFSRFLTFSKIQLYHFKLCLDRVTFSFSYCPKFRKFVTAEASDNDINNTENSQKAST